MYSSKVAYVDVLRAGKLDSLCSVCLSQVMYQSARVEMHLEAADLHLCNTCRTGVLQAARIQEATRQTEELKAQFLDSLSSECQVPDSGSMPVLVVLPTGESLTVQADVTTQRVNTFGTSSMTSYCRFRLPEIATTVVDRVY